MLFAHGESVTILRASSQMDRNGNPVPGPDAEITVAGCAVGPRFSTEPVEAGRQQVVSGLTVYMPPGTDVRASDRLRVRGVVRRVEGEPFDFVNPFTGWRPGVAVEVEGALG